MQYVYIDGFNVYHGCVKNTKYKWLDYRKLIEKLTPEHTSNNIYYFTARVKNNPPKAERQDVYLRALKNDGIHIVYGHFSIHPKKRKLAAVDKVVSVICPEEKGSDVNIACHMLYDALLKEDCAQLLLLSNDSDLIMPIKMIKRETNKKVGVAFPVALPKRKMSQVLKQEAHFWKRIDTSLIEECQLPSVIPNTNIKKPVAW